MVEVFKTNVQERQEAERLVYLLSRKFPGSRVNFDLDDCDNILRVEGKHFDTQQVIMSLAEKGFACCLLE